MYDIYEVDDRAYEQAEQDRKECADVATVTDAVASRSVDTMLGARIDLDEDPDALRRFMLG